jgi:hypothetical protein
MRGLLTAVTAVAGVIAVACGGSSTSSQTAERSQAQSPSAVSTSASGGSGPTPGRAGSTPDSRATSQPHGAAASAASSPSPATSCAAPANPWGYSFCGDSLIFAPPANFCGYFTCIAGFSSDTGFVVQCTDGLYSRSGRPGDACSSHGGIRRPLYAPGP